MFIKNRDNGAVIGFSGEEAPAGWDFVKEPEHAAELLGAPDIDAADEAKAKKAAAEKKAAAK